MVRVIRRTPSPASSDASRTVGLPATAFPRNVRFAPSGRVASRTYSPAPLPAFKTAALRYFPFSTSISRLAESVESFQAQLAVSVQAPWELPRFAWPVPRQLPTSPPNGFKAA